MSSDQGPITPRRSYRRWHYAPKDSWNANRIAAAMTMWAEETGSPPLSYEWCPSTLRSAGRAGPEPTKWEREHPRWPGSTTVYRYFASWAGALEAAGLPPGPRHPERPLPERVELALTLRGEGASLDAIADAVGVSKPTAARYLSSHACSTCGGPVVGEGELCRPCATRRGNPRRWSEQEVLEAVHEWVRLEGRPPTQTQWAGTGDPQNRWHREFPRWPPTGVSTLMFGGWSAMLKAAGLTPNKHYWTREEILAAIRAHAHRAGVPPSKTEWEYGDEGRPSAKTVRMAFGSFTEGIRAAGFEPAIKRWSADDVTRAFAAFEAKHGRAPKTSDWRRSSPDHPVPATVLKHFPTWEAAVKAGRRRTLFGE